ncbi:hypothetical protein GGH92_010901, partial [Coemansia sp. RSA 2673]
MQDIQRPLDPLGPLLAAASLSHQPVVLDGGFGQLIADEYPHISQKDGLWVSGAAARMPNVIKDAHTRYLEAGADIITTATYQASANGYKAAGLVATEAEADALMAATVGLAVEARAECLSTDALRDQVDLLAMETIPSAVEAGAIVRALDELGQRGTDLPAAWIAFTTRVPDQTGLGEPIEDAVAAATSSSRICAVGINCVSMHVVPELLANISRVSPVPVVCYPNGQTWLGSAGGWGDASAQ